MLGKKTLAFISLFLLLMLLVCHQQGEVTVLSGLQDKVRVIRDEFGVPHIFASNDHDVYFIMGYFHANDRFFQIDMNRRQASGTLAELLGPGPNDQTLSSDIQLRTIGLRRAAERSVGAYPPETIAILQAFADGVNAWLDSNPLPPEYALLDLTEAGVPPWDIVDSIVLTKAFALQISSTHNFDLNDTETFIAYQAAGQSEGFDGTALYFDDLFRSTPFDSTISIPGFFPGQQTAGTGAQAKLCAETLKQAKRAQEQIKPHTLTAIAEFLKDTQDNPLLNGERKGGSNTWVLSGAKTDTGLPMLENDEHLALPSPPVFYEIHLVVSGGNQPPMNVYGVSSPGIPGVAAGFNDRIAWGNTVNPVDDLDFYEEQVIVDPTTQQPVATVFQATPELLTIIPETFKINQMGSATPDDIVVVPPGMRPSGVIVPADTFVVHRISDGPLITMPMGPPEHLTAIGMQFTAFSPTREVDAVLTFARAQNLDDFKEALQFWDAPSLNWSYADIDGNIAYFTSAELPLREDLQAGAVDGFPPFFIRDGTGTLKNEWIPDDKPPPDQSLPFEILPFDEMPQVVNQAQGFIANSNNDPIGITLENDPLSHVRPDGGIYYLIYTYSGGCCRVGQVVRLIQEELDTDGTISFEDMMRIQSNAQMLDAEVLTPYILQAFENAQAPGAPPELAVFASGPAVSEAVGRLAQWDFSTPTGIRDGYDASDEGGGRSPPTPEEIAHSIGATIYSMWRGQVIMNTIDATLQGVGLGDFLPEFDPQVLAGLRNLLDNFATTGGRGASGLNFFDVPGVDLPPEGERDIILLTSLEDGLNLLASEGFAPAFDMSSNQDDYRWGKLHRIVFSHPLGDGFSIPTGAGFPDLSSDLPGISRQGGFQTVDFAGHPARADSLNGFMFNDGPVRRFIGDVESNGIRAIQVLPGGESGVPDNRFFGSQLGLWLTDEYHNLFFNVEEVHQNRFSQEVFEPPG